MSPQIPTNPAHPACRATPANAVLCLLAVLLLATPAAPCAEREGAAPIVLGPGVAAANVEEPFEYFTNSWTVIGLRDYPSGTRVSPRGELLLAGGMVVRPLAGESLLPLHRRIAKTLRKGWIPIVKMDFVLDGSLRITLEAHAEPLRPPPPSEPGAPAISPGTSPPISPDNYRNVLEATIRNVGKESLRGRIGLEWRPEMALGLRAFAKGSPSPDPEGERCMVEAGGKALAGVRLPAGGTAAAEGSRLLLEAPLEAGEALTFLISLPFEPIDLGGGGANEWAIVPRSRDEDVSREWEGLLGAHVSLAIPERKVEETFKASLVYQLIGRDGPELHAGEGFYDEVYIRDAAYQAISLAHAGFLDEAREGLEVFRRFQRPDGQFVSQAKQLDANGYAMWAPVELAKLSGDLEFLRMSYGPIRKAAEWAMAARRTEEDPSSPFFGVLPAAVADGEFLWAGKNHIVGYDWWNLRGIASVAEAARMLGEVSDAERFEKEFREYRRDILKALDRTDVPYIPPSYEKDGTHWGNLEVVFPTPLVDPRDDRVTATLAHVRNDFGLPGGPTGLVEGTLQWCPGRGAIHPYMSQFVTNTHIVRGEQDEAVDGFYSFLLHTTSTHGFPEGVYFQRREAWGDTVPHLWAAALYVTTLRNMLLREEGDDLHILSAVPAGWLEPGKTIELSGAPTNFGRVDLRVHAEDELAEDARAEGDRAEGERADGDRSPGSRGRIRVRLRGLERGRPAPRMIVIHLPPSLRMLAARTGPASGGAGGLPLVPRDGKLAVAPAAAPAAADAWRCDAWIDIERDRSLPAPDFDAKVASYLAAAPDLDRPIPGLVPVLPAAIDEEDCVRLDLASVATTNPLDRPFLARGPAFEGIPIGDARVAGVPFRTVDPATNGGKGLVVLQGASTCAGLPVEAVVPARGVEGRLLVVLGNVTGWGPGDPGTGRWGAVGEYEIRYADGTALTIPLITGRTCDDWLGTPGASDVADVLRGAPWHLNVLAIAIEPKPLECVVIRDLGTPASPVVAAMTVVR